MMGALARHLPAHHCTLSQAASRCFAAPTRAIRQDADSLCSSCRAEALNDTDTARNVGLPQVKLSETRLDLIKTYIQRFEGEHFDTIIDPQFPTETGLPMTVYVSQKQDFRPPSVEVSQYYGRHHSLHNIFTVTIPKQKNETCRIVGDTGTIKINDIVKVCRYIRKNRQLLLDVWEHGQDETNEMAWKYYLYLKQV